MIRVGGPVRDGEAGVVNEKITENLVRDLLRANGFYDSNKPIFVEEQKSQNPIVDKCLRNASKTGKGGCGKPKFIVLSPVVNDFVFVFECKPTVVKHESPDRDEYADYAVDGVLNYASFLSKEFNVIAVAVSGQRASELRISNFLWVKQAKAPASLTNHQGTVIDRIVSFDDYLNYASFDHELASARFNDLMAFSRYIHNYMRDYAKLSETEKPLLVSGILIALLNNAFQHNYKDYTPEELPKELYEALSREINKADIPNAKKQNMVQPYSFIQVHPELSKFNVETKQGPLYHLIKEINDHVAPFVSAYHNFDVIGQFYGEFLRYTGGDKKGLGIVLTPKHISELFAKIANLTTESTVLDICCGTAGFLIASMHEMFRKAQTDTQRERIRKDGLVGVEQQPNMYALAASNMILRGDGKANLYLGSCFDEAITKEIADKKPTVGMINPPYSQKGEGLYELDFVKHMLDCLQPGSIGIAIVPMSCAIVPHPSRQRILKEHFLRAVMSLPDELFYPVGTVTCIMVFEAHRPHAQENRKTWFGYWKNDGFKKTKYNGRVDLNGQWNEIRDHWLDTYRNQDEVLGYSVKQQVGPDDEWCAEAYMQTDYSKLTQSDFEMVIKRLLAYRLLSGGQPENAEEVCEE